MGLFYIAIFIVGVILLYKLLRSRWWDGIWKNAISGELEDTPNDVIKDISKAEKTLSKHAEKDVKEANILNKEADNIDTFLGSRGVIKDKKREGL